MLGRNSPVMHPSVPEACCCSVLAFLMWLLLIFQSQEFKPLLFSNGQKIPFPEPTKAGDARRDLSLDVCGRFCSATDAEAPRRPRMKKHARIGCRRGVSGLFLYLFIRLCCEN